LAVALKSYLQNMPKYEAFGTYEATPGIGTRHLPELPRAPLAERERFAADPRSSWTEQGRDVIYNALGMRQRPTLPATGIFEGPAGLEINPAQVARPMVGFAGPPGERGFAPTSRALLQAGFACLHRCAECGRCVEADSIPESGRVNFGRDADRQEAHIGRGR
jgi:hypothetical protein